MIKAGLARRECSFSCHSRLDHAADLADVIPVIIFNNAFSSTANHRAHKPGTFNSLSVEPSIQPRLQYEIALTEIANRLWVCSLDTQFPAVELRL